MDDLMASRRDLLLATLPMALPAAFMDGHGRAVGVDPSMTIIKRPERIPWKQLYNFPAGSAEQAVMAGDLKQPGQYFVLIRWHSGFMSAPHYYETDRLCVVLSGIWWVASGTDFDPESTVPVPAGSFVRRVARTPHYDGVKRLGTEPAVIAISGIGPITFHPTDPSRPGWRAV
jgi:hypothetical protein